MARPKKVTLKLYEHHYIFCLNQKPDVFRKWYRKTFKLDIDLTGADGATIPVSAENTIIIWTENNSDLTLLHECVHAAHMTLYDIGHKANYLNDEVDAYLISYLFSKAKS